MGKFSFINQKSWIQVYNLNTINKILFFCWYFMKCMKTFEWFGVHSFRPIYPYLKTYYTIRSPLIWKKKKNWSLKKIHSSYISRTHSVHIRLLYEMAIVYVWDRRKKDYFAVGAVKVHISSWTRKKKVVQNQIRPPLFVVDIHLYTWV